MHEWSINIWVIRALQIKHTRRCLYTPTRITKIKKISNTKYLWKCTVTGTLIHCWAVKRLLWTRTGRFLQYSLWTYPGHCNFTPRYLLKRYENICPDIDLYMNDCFWQFIIFLVAKNWNRPRRPSVGEWIWKCATFRQWNVTQ